MHLARLRLGSCKVRVASVYSVDTGFQGSPKLQMVMALKAARDILHDGLFGPKSGFQHLNQQIDLHFFTAGEDVTSRKIMLGPSVNSHVRFGDNDNTGHALWGKFMKNVFNDARFRGRNSLKHFQAQLVLIVQNVGTAMDEIYKIVFPKLH